MNHSLNKIIPRILTSGRPPSQPTRPHHCATAKSFADVVHLFEQFDLFDGVFEEVDLVGAADEAGEFHTDEADELPSFEELVEEVEDVAGEDVVVGGIGDLALFGVGVKIGISDFNGNAGGKFFVVAQFKGEFVGHVEQQVAHVTQVEGVFGEGAFFGHGFLFVVGHYRTAVDGVGFFPKGATVLTKFAFEQPGRDEAEGADVSHTHKAEFFVGFLAHTGDLGYCQWGQEFFLYAGVYLPGTVGLGLTGADLGYQLVDRQAKGNGQAGFFGDALPQLERPLVTTKVLVHARDVEVKFIN